MSEEKIDPYISELRAGQRVRGVYGVQRKQLRTFRDEQKGYYLDLQLGDRSGSLPGRVWDDASEVKDTFAEGDVVRIQATVQTYRGQNQLVIDEIVPLDLDAVPAERFIAKSPRPPEDMQEDLWQLIESVDNRHLAQLLTEMFGDPAFYRKYTLMPAAKRVHHNYLHGLLEHSLEVARLASEGVRDTDDLNTDLLVAGGILHDVGKIEELACAGSIQYTVDGRLLGHVVLGFRMVTSRVEGIPDFPGPLARHLQHLIISHHGQQEYGAPVLPQTREAVILHQADMFSGKASQVTITTESARKKGSRWSEYDQLLGRSMWIPDNCSE